MQEGIPQRLQNNDNDNDNDNNALTLLSSDHVLGGVLSVLSELSIFGHATWLVGS